MRICILGSPRSGTTSLMEYISDSLKLNRYNEPYSYSSGTQLRKNNVTEDNIWRDKNTVVKHLMFQLSTEQKKTLRDSFDKVVCIYRKDLKSSSESWLAGYYSDNWERPYNYKDTKAYRPTKINTESKNFIIQQRIKEIKEIKELGYFTVTYEDLFYSDKDKLKLNNYLGITNPSLDILDPINKLRLDPIVNKTII
jgi:hypothetical protein